MALLNEFEHTPKSLKIYAIHFCSTFFDFNSTEMCLRPKGKFPNQNFL